MLAAISDDLTAMAVAIGLTKHRGFRPTLTAVAIGPTEDKVVVQQPWLPDPDTSPVPANDKWTHEQVCQSLMDFPQLERSLYVQSTGIRYGMRH